MKINNSGTGPSNTHSLLKQLVAQHAHSLDSADAAEIGLPSGNTQHRSKKALALQQVISDFYPANPNGALGSQAFQNQVKTPQASSGNGPSLAQTLSRLAPSTSQQQVAQPMQTDLASQQPSTQAASQFPSQKRKKSQTSKDKGHKQLGHGSGSTTMVEGRTTPMGFITNEPPQHSQHKTLQKNQVGSGGHNSLIQLNKQSSRNFKKRGSSKQQSFLAKGGDSQQLLSINLPQQHTISGIPSSTAAMLKPYQTALIAQLQSNSRKQSTKRQLSQESAKQNQQTDQLSEFLRQQVSQFDQANNGGQGLHQGKHLGGCGSQFTTLNNNNLSLNSQYPSLMTQQPTQILSRHQPLRIASDTEMLEEGTNVPKLQAFDELRPISAASLYPQAQLGNCGLERKQGRKISLKHNNKKRMEFAKTQQLQLPLTSQQQLSKNPSTANLLQTYNKLIYNLQGAVTDNHNSLGGVTLNDKLSRVVFSQTAPSDSLKANLSGAYNSQIYEMLPGNGKLSSLASGKVSQLAIEGPDSDQIPSQKGGKGEYHPSSMLIKERALSNELKHLVSDSPAGKGSAKKQPSGAQTKSSLSPTTSQKSLASPKGNLNNFASGSISQNQPYNPQDLLMIIEEQKKMMKQMSSEKSQLQRTVSAMQSQARQTQKLQQQLSQKDILINNLQTAITRGSQLRQQQLSPSKICSGPLSLREDHKSGSKQYQPSYMYQIQQVQQQQQPNESLSQQSNNYLSEEFVSVLGCSSDKKKKTKKHVYQSYLNAYDVQQLPQQTYKGYTSSPSHGLKRCKTASQEHHHLSQASKQEEQREMKPSISAIEKHFMQFQMEVTEKENTQINKDLFLLRAKMHAFVGNYGKYIGKLKDKIGKLESENLELKQWKMKHIAKAKNQSIKEKVKEASQQQQLVMQPDIN